MTFIRSKERYSKETIRNKESRQELQRWPFPTGKQHTHTQSMHHMAKPWHLTWYYLLHHRSKTFFSFLRSKPVFEACCHPRSTAPLGGQLNVSSRIPLYYDEQEQIQPGCLMDSNNHFSIWTKLITGTLHGPTKHHFPCALKSQIPASMLQFTSAIIARNFNLDWPPERRPCKN